MSSLGLIILRRNYTREPVSTITIYWYFPSAGHSKINNSGISQSNHKQMARKRIHIPSAPLTVLY